MRAGRDATGLSASTHTPPGSSTMLAMNAKSSKRKRACRSIGTVMMLGVLVKPIV